MKTANTALDGTGTVLTVFTAGANGSFVQKIVARAAGTNIQSVLRVFLNNGSTNATIANSILLTEMTLAATTASANGQLQTSEIGINYAIPAGYKINVTLGTTIAAGVCVSCVGGDY